MSFWSQTVSLIWALQSLIVAVVPLSALMTAWTASPPSTALLQKLEVVDKRLDELEQAKTDSPARAEDTTTSKDVEAKAESEANNENKDRKEYTSRVKIEIIFRDPNTNEPTIKDSNPTKDESIDGSELAFRLKKIVYEQDMMPGVPSKSEIEVTNPHLWNLLAKNLGHYPYHMFRGSSITLNSPFEPIVMYFDELSNAAKTETDGESVDEKVAREDLVRLLDIISGGKSGDEKLDKYFKLRMNRKNKDPETISFQDLWTVFKPGMLVYGRPFHDSEQVFVVKDNIVPWPWKDDDQTASDRMAPWQLEAWSYDWNNKHFSRTLFTLTFEDFEGQRPLTSLPFYPFELHKDRKDIAARLIKRGKRFRDICEAKEGARLFEFEGKVIVEKTGFTNAFTELMSDMLMLFGSGRKTSRSKLVMSSASSEVSSRVMVDYEAFFQYASSSARNGELEPGLSGRECTCSDCEGNVEFRKIYRTKFDDQEHAKAPSWDDEQYMLCPPRVLGYILVHKQWAQLHVEGLRTPPREDNTRAWEKRLKLSDDQMKKTLFDLVRSHASATGPDEESTSPLQVDDIVPGKGKGLVILLYGPPGVGKTLTAETISTAIRKPLFAVSVADVGTDPKNVEVNLSNIFALATKWQAILLIDEADVFLESRGRGTAIRSTDQNALVSVFLRVLEYYHGIMFLTTNQIADFDVAIPSRIHMAVSYPSLKKEQMQAIFFNFLDKLDENDLIEDYKGIKEWLNDTVYEQNIDGRQIRNIVTTALSLARAGTKYHGEPERLTKAHLKNAFSNVKKFKMDYRDQYQAYKESQKQMIRMEH